MSVSREVWVCTQGVTQPGWGTSARDSHVKAHSAFSSVDVSVTTTPMEEAAALHSQPPQNTTAPPRAEIGRSWQSSPYRAIYTAASASVKKACRSSQSRMSAGKVSPRHGCIHKTGATAKPASLSAREGQTVVRPTLDRNCPQQKAAGRRHCLALG